MDRKINIFGVDITILTAKEAMKRTIEYLEEETANTIEIVTLEMLMKEKDNDVWKEQLQKFNLLLPGEKALFETSEESDRNLIRDVENRTYLKILFKYLQKNKKKVFLLAENEEDLKQTEKQLRAYAHSLRIAGQAVLSEDGGMEENVINEINGVEPDCILSVLSVPYGEKFAAECRALLNARLWLGGLSALSMVTAKKPMKRIGQFVMKKIFRYQMEKQKTEETDND